MRKYIKSAILLVLLAILSGGIATNAVAQEIVVKDVSALPSNTYATDHPRTFEDQTCAVVIFKTNNIEDLTFPVKGQHVGDIEHEGSNYYVYLVPGAYNISFQHKDYQPGSVNLFDAAGFKAKAGRTYQVILEAPTLGKHGNMSTVSIKVFPTVSGTVTFNGAKYPIQSNGRVEFDVPQGTYHYTVEAPDYDNVSGEMSVNQKAVVKNISLKHTMVQGSVSCNVSTAHVFIDNVDYGKVGELSLPVGRHEVRVAEDGYLDYQRIHTLADGTSNISCTLEKNKGKRIDIHATPVTIYSDSRRVYKNNKPIEGWHDGAVIKFTPGVMCKLSDSSGKAHKFTPGSEPLTVTINGDEFIVR